MDKFHHKVHRHKKLIKKEQLNKSQGTLIMDKFRYKVHKHKKLKKLIKKEQLNKSQGTMASLYDRVSTITDKGTCHSYIDYYERLFKPHRNKKINLLEIGVLQGGSLILWSKYFTKGTIYGIDISPNNINFPSNIKFFQCNATNEQDLVVLGDIKFDIIIDDASHNISDQLASVKILWKKMKWWSLYYRRHTIMELYRNISKNI